MSQVSSFFHWLKYVNDAYTGATVYTDSEGNIVKYKEECHETLNRLINYIEHCDFSTKKVDRFLCANWQLKKGELLELWVKQFGKPKNEATFRSQLSTLSHELYNLFGNEWPSDFMDDNCTEIKHRLDMLEGLATNFDLVAPPDLVKKITYRGYKKYAIEKLQDELQYLHTYNAEKIKHQGEALDVDKLAYIKDRLNEPICLNGKYNETKAEILRVIQETDYKPLSEPIENVISAKQIKLWSDIMRQNVDKESNEERIDELKEFMYRAFTLEGLSEYLSQFSTGDMKRVYKELNEGK